MSLRTIAVSFVLCACGVANAQMVIERAGTSLRARGDAFLHGNADRVAFAGLKGRTFNARKTWSDLRGPGDLAWMGQLEDEPGSVSFTYTNGLLAGLISTREGNFEVRTSANGEVRVEPVVELGKCLNGPNDAVASTGARGRLSLLPYRKAAPSLERTAEGTAQITVAVVYTSDAKDEAGGEEQIENMVRAAVDTVNLSFKNSDVNAKVTLVATAETPYVETDNDKQSEYLTTLREDEQVQDLREKTEADLVALIISKGEGEETACGYGYLLTKENAETGAGGFSVSKLSCAIGGLTFAHELGHNMGLNHDPANSPEPDKVYIPYAYGHLVDGAFRTVLSYATSCKKNCTRIPVYSDPEITYDGIPTGIEDERHNARALRLTTPVVAKFR